MMRRFFRELGREIRDFRRVHLKALLSIALVELIYIALYGALFANNAAKGVPVLVLDEDGGAYSRAFVEIMTEQEDIDVAAIYMSEDELADGASLHEHYAVVKIPQKFSHDLSCGVPVNVGVIVNNSNTVLGGTAVRGVSAAISAMNARCMEMLCVSKGWQAEDAARSLAKISLSERPMGNATGGYIDFFLPVFVLHSMQIAIVFIVAPAVSLGLNMRRRRRVRHPMPFVAAKIFALGIFEVLVIFTASIMAYLVYDMKLLGGAMSMAAVGASFAVTMTTFAIMMGCLVSSPAESVVMSIGYIMPSIVFCGALWPRTSMDSISSFISHIIPVGYAAEPFRDITALGYSTHIWSSVAAQLCFTAIFFTVSCVWLYRLSHNENMKKVNGYLKARAENV